MNSKDYTPTEKERLVLTYISDFNKKNRVFFQNNPTMAEKLELSERSIRSMISRLYKNGYLSKNKDSNGRRILTYTGKPYKTLQLYPHLSQLECQKIKKDDKKLKQEQKKLLLENEQLKNKIKELEDKLKNLHPEE